MPVSFYFDHNVWRSIENGARRRGVDVVTAAYDGMQRAPDELLLDRAGELGRALFTMDVDFLIEAARRRKNGQPFTGIVYVHQERATVSEVVEDLVLVAEVYTVEELANEVVFLPIKATGS